MLRYDPYDRSVRTKELEQLHKYRCPSQRMAFLTQETAMNDPLESDLSLPEGFFNWTITYRRDSDFHLPYASYVRLPSAENPPELVNYAADKNKFVLWAVSRCGRIRDKYVKKLLKYIKVDIYGGCSDYYGPDVVPQGSFISVQDFPSVKALAEYLMYLDKNDTAYNEYFSWKQEFVYEQRSRFRYAACDICDALHNECLKPKVYHDIFKTFWNEEVDCTEREQTLLKLIDRE
ncbi:hypothetical protein ACROYT_G027125 [Oculina patagonica]